jgi:hypothetical protein
MTMLLDNNEYIESNGKKFYLRVEIQSHMIF